MWIRCYTSAENDHLREERLINTAHISTINVRYGKGGYSVSVRDGQNDEEAEREFTFTVAGETSTFRSRPGDPVWEVLSDIYKSAVKSPDT
jgi:hypothetical protein